MCLSVSQDHFQTQITNRCPDFNDELHRRGQRLIFHHKHLNLHIVSAFPIYDSFSEASTDLHLHVFSSDLTTAPWPNCFTLSAALITVSSY